MGERVYDGGPGQQPQAEAEVQCEQAGGRAAAVAPEVEADDAAAGRQHGQGGPDGRVHRVHGRHGGGPRDDGQRGAQAVQRNSLGQL